jgi:hypothetical protein
MTDAEVLYPNVRCALDGTVAPGFCVCRHVAHQGALIAHYVTPTHRQTGEAFCDACTTKKSNLAVADLLLVCGQCVARLIAAVARA